jgi:Transglutaminase-like superfamily
MSNEFSQSRPTQMLGWFLFICLIVSSFPTLPGCSKKTPPAPTTVPLTYEQAEHGIGEEITGVQSFQSGLNKAEFDVQAKAKELGPNAENAFSYVHDQIAFEVYPGVLRGSFGTLLSRAGNSLDKSQLLAALLKANGILVRFASGTLDDEKAQALVTQMLQRQDEAKSQESATISASTDKHQADDYLIKERVFKSIMQQVEVDRRVISTVLTDNNIRPTLDWQAQRDSLAKEAKQHIWVQYQRGDQWIDLDPSFANSKLGDQPVVPDKTYQELPDELYQTITFNVQIEQLRDKHLSTQMLLEVTRKTADLIGASISLTNIPNLQEGEITLAAFEKASRFLPVINIDGYENHDRGFDLHGNAFPGSEFSPGESSGTGGATTQAAKKLGSIFDEQTKKPEDNSSESYLSAQWIELAVNVPGGQRRTYRREIFDRIGIDNRETNNEKAIKAEYGDEKRLRYLLATQQAILIDSAALSTRFIMNEVASQIMSKTDLIHAEVKSAFDKENTTAETSVTKYADAFKRGISIELMSMSRNTKSLGDRLVADSYPGTLFYRATPGIVSFKTKLDVEPGGKLMMRRGFDIIENAFRTVSQDPAKAWQLGLTLGVMQTHLEKQLALEFHAIFAGQIDEDEKLRAQFNVEPRSLSAIDVLDSARKSGSQGQLIRSYDEESLPRNISAEAKQRIKKELTSGFVLLSPEKGVEFNGRQLAAWWRIDPVTGNAVGVMDSGEGQAFVEKIIHTGQAVMLRTVIWLFSYRIQIGAFLVSACVATIANWVLVGLGAKPGDRDEAAGFAFLVCPLAQSWLDSTSPRSASRGPSTERQPPNRPPANVRLGGSLDDPAFGGDFRCGAYDPETNTLYLGRGGHFDGMADAGGTPHPRLSRGISFLETPTKVYWANDSLSLPFAMTSDEANAVQRGLESAFPGKTVVQLTSIGEAGH